MRKIITLIIIISMIFNYNVLGDVNVDSKTEFETQAEAVVLMEASTGEILTSKNENKKLSPASITKIMTLILIFDNIKSGKINLNDLATTSAYAKSMGGSQVFLEEGEQQTVETLIKCIVIASGNDASVTMAEHIAGSEEAFVKMMNERAKNLGMNNSNFVDCCGLTDSDEHYTSAKDVAIMSRELITKYPEIYNYSTIWMETIIHKTKQGEKEFVLTNTNKMLKSNQFVKGLKTGSTSKAKYCVSNVAVKEDVELISVVMAAPDYKQRFVISEQLINYGFANCKVYKDTDKHTQKATVLGGIKDEINVISKGFSYVDTQGNDLSKVDTKVIINKNLKAPINKGDAIGKIEYKLNGKKIGETDIVANENVKKARYINQFVKMLKLLVMN